MWLYVFVQGKWRVSDDNISHGSGGNINQSNCVCDGWMSVFKACSESCNISNTCWGFRLTVNSPPVSTGLGGIFCGLAAHKPFVTTLHINKV